MVAMVQLEKHKGEGNKPGSSHGVNPASSMYEMRRDARNVNTDVQAPYRFLMPSLSIRE
jgi:hypothetical protein